MRLATGSAVARTAAAGSAFLALSSGGAFPSWTLLVYPAGLGAALYLGSRPPAWLAPLLTVATAGWLAILLFLLATGRTDPVILASSFGAAVAMRQLLCRKGASDDGLIYLTSLLMLAAGAALSGELAYGAWFVLYSAAVTVGLALSHAERAADDIGAGESERQRPVSPALVGALLGLSGLSLCGAVAFFALFPRLNAHWLGRFKGAAINPMTGFSNQVTLGGYGLLRDDPRPAMRVRLPDQPLREKLALLWRGQSLDHFDGRSWTVSEGRPRPLGTQVPRGNGVVHALVEVLPLAAARLAFSAGQIRAGRMLHPPLMASTDPGDRRSLMVRPGGDVLVAPPPAGSYAYEVWSVLPAESELPGRGTVYPPDIRAADLQLPDLLDARIGSLAREWAGSLREPLEVARAVQHHLRGDYAYSTQLPGAAQDPLADFLFRRKKGHCELFSTAMVVMLRALGIPAREVTGFIGGELAPGGEYYLLRAGDAHSWTEVYFPGVGFVGFDPTPPSARDAAPHGLLAYLEALSDVLSRRWAATVLDYNLTDQVQMLRRLGEAAGAVQDRFSRPASHRTRWWVPVAFLAVLGAGTLGIRQLRRWSSRRSVPEHPASAVYQRMLRSLARHGVYRAASETPRELADRVATALPTQAAAVREVTAIYYRARYGEPTAADSNRMRELVARL